MKKKNCCTSRALQLCGKTQVATSMNGMLTLLSQRCCKLTMLEIRSSVINVRKWCKVPPLSSSLQHTQTRYPIPYLSSSPVLALLENVVPIQFPPWQHSACPVSACHQSYSQYPLISDVLICGSF